MSEVRGPIGLILVVLPARDEQARLPACLDAIDAARRLVSDGRAVRAWPAPRVRTLVVLDRCTDGTAAIARGRSGVETIVSCAGRVGSARALGVLTGLRGEGLSRERIWIASTDADSCVPATWLSHQLDLAHAGADLYRGLVEPDVEECGPTAYDAWARDYSRNDGHPHVHGANLGIRADAYLRCGGFDVRGAAHEDVELARAAARLTLNVVATSAASVATSGRLAGRVSGAGFAHYLGLL